MKIISIYIFKQVGAYFLYITLFFTSLIWLMISLKYIEYVTSNGLSFLSFISLTSLLIPTVVPFLTPFSLALSCIFVYHKLSNDNEINNANIISYEANNVLIKTSNSDASILILTDVYYPGWKAFIDGTETKIYRADGLVKAIFVPEGEHTIEFVYLPESYNTGITISIITVLILVAIYFVSRNKYRRLKIEKAG